MAFDIIARDAPPGTAFDIVINDQSVGESSGVGTASGTGTSTTTGVGSASGSSTASATGSSTAVGVGSASGTSSATATGASVVIGTGSTSGTSTATADGISATIGEGSASGTSTASADGVAYAEGVGESLGSSTADASGEAQVIGVGSASGTSTAFAFTVYAFADYVSSLTVRDHLGSLTLVDMSYQIGQGDLAPDIVFEAGVNGEPVDLSDITNPRLRWWKPNGEYIEVAVAAMDLALGLFTREWQPGDTDEIGTHRAKLIVTRGNGDQQTFPSDGTFLRWRVT